MIQHTLSYLLLIGLLSLLALYLAGSKQRLFHYLPPIVLLYLGFMFLGSLGMIHFDDEMTQTSKRLSGNLLPAMIFLMLLPHKSTAFARLGSKLVTSFLLSTFSLCLAFTLVLLLFSHTAQSIDIFIPLAGTWMGGTANMLSIHQAIGASDTDLGVTMLIDSLNYTFWLLLLLLIVPLAPRFNKMTRSRHDAEELMGDGHCALHFSPYHYALLLFSALLISLLSQLAAEPLAQFLGGSVTTWRVLFATLSGIIFAYTPLARIKGLGTTANGMLYLLVALIASRSSLAWDTTLLSYIGMGTCILLVHALLMITGAKLFKLDLFSISVASLSHIGGIASAPILSAAYAQSLVGIGVIMAAMGYVIGTFVALGLWEILKWLL